MNVKIENIDEYLSLTNHLLSSDKIQEYYSLFTKLCNEEHDDNLKETKSDIQKSNHTLSKSKLISELNKAEEDPITKRIISIANDFPIDSLDFKSFLRIFTYNYYIDTDASLFSPIYEQLIRNGALDFKGLFSALKDINEDITEEQLKEVFIDRGVSLDEKIDFESFLKLVKEEISK